MSASSQTESFVPAWLTGGCPDEPISDECVGILFGMPSSLFGTRSADINVFENGKIEVRLLHPFGFDNHEAFGFLEKVKAQYGVGKVVRDATSPAGLQAFVAEDDDAIVFMRKLRPCLVLQQPISWTKGVMNAILAWDAKGRPRGDALVKLRKEIDELKNSVMSTADRLSFITNPDVMKQFCDKYLDNPEKKPRLEACANPACFATTGKDGNTLKTCSGCKCVKYCSKECQKLHWKQHKKFCKRAKGG